MSIAAVESSKVAPADRTWRTGLLASKPLVVILLVFVGANLAWLLVDRRVWAWDQAWYGEVSTDLYFALTHAPSDWYHAMLALMPSKPPLLVWIGQFAVPLGHAAGSVDVALLCLILLMQVATLAVVWAIAQRMSPGNPWSAALPTTLLAASPLYVGMTHQYFVEPLQGLVVASSLLLVLVARHLSALRLLGWLVLLVAAGIGAKTTTPAYCGAAWAVSATQLLGKLFRSDPGRFRDPAGWGLLAAALILGGVTGHWYAQNLADMLGHVRDSTEGERALLYGQRAAFLVKLGFWLRALNDAVFLVPTLASLLLILVALLAAVRLTTKGAAHAGRTPEAWALIAAALSLLTALALLASQPNEETRFLLPALPSLAVLAGWLFGSPHARRIAAGACVLLVLQFTLVNVEALGGFPRLARSAWLLPASHDRTARILAHDVVERTCAKQLANSYTVIGPEYPQFNANSMSYFAAKERLDAGYRCYYTSLGYAETNTQRALDRIDNLNARFVVLPRRESLPADLDAFNKVLGTTEEAVSGSPRFGEVGEEGDYEIFARH